MAEGFLKSFASELEVFSAGTIPADKVNPNSVIVMDEVDIDISSQYPQDVDEFIEQPFDYVPADATGTEQEVLAVYRRVRDEIKERFIQFYKKELVH
jgi:arsenate reductase